MELFGSDEIISIPQDMLSDGFFQGIDLEEPILPASADSSSTISDDAQDPPAKRLKTKDEEKQGKEEIEVATQKEVAEQLKITQDPAWKGAFREMPLEILGYIFSFLPNANGEVSELRGLNKAFYQFITGYNKLGLVGVNNKPALYMQIPISSRSIDFSSEGFKGLTPDNINNIPSLFFFKLMSEAKYLPEFLWPYLKHTQVKVLDLSAKYFGNPPLIGATSEVSNAVVEEELQQEQNTIRWIEELAANLPECLEKIDLDHNSISDVAVIKLAESLKKLPSLKSINLGFNKISCAGALNFVKMMQGSPLKSLGLRGSSINEEGLIELAKRLQGFPLLDEICLSNNSISDARAAEFIRSLSANVHVLDLSSNDIGKYGAVELAQSLGDSKIVEIDLFACKMKESWLIEFTQNLATNTSLKKIILSIDDISDGVALEFVEKLSYTGIEEVHLENNLDSEAPALIKEKYPHIEWVFS
jgi:hypothetical protein